MDAPVHVAVHVGPGVNVNNARERVGSTRLRVAGEKIEVEEEREWRSQAEKRGVIGEMGILASTACLLSSSLSPSLSPSSSPSPVALSSPEARWEEEEEEVDDDE